jgi:hypothetical protein
MQQVNEEALAKIQGSSFEQKYTKVKGLGVGDRIKRRDTYLQK